MRIAQAARAGFLALGFAFAACAAQAQLPTDYVGGQKTFGSWQSLGFAPVMSVSTTTSNEAFGTAVRGPVVKICNIGADNVVRVAERIRFNDRHAYNRDAHSPGCWSLYAAGATNIAAISVGGSTTLNIELGSGNFNYAPAPSTSNGPTSNVNVLNRPTVNAALASMSPTSFQATVTASVRRSRVTLRLRPGLHGALDKHRNHLRRRVRRHDFDRISADRRPSISDAVNNSNLIYIIGTNTSDVLACTGN